MDTLAFGEFAGEEEAVRSFERVLPAGSARTRIESVMRNSGAEVFAHGDGLLCIWEGNLAPMLKRKWMVSIALDARGGRGGFSIQTGIVGL